MYSTINIGMDLSKFCSAIYNRFLYNLFPYRLHITLSLCLPSKYHNNMKFFFVLRRVALIACSPACHGAHAHTTINTGGAHTQQRPGHITECSTTPSSSCCRHLCSSVAGLASWARAGSRAAPGASLWSCRGAARAPPASRCCAGSDPGR